MLLTINPFILGIIPYFPEDKSEYIPALIQIGIVMIIAILVVFLFKKISKKQELEAKKIEEKMKKYQENEHS